LCLSSVVVGAPAKGSFPRLESSFSVPAAKGNPFDYTQNDVQVTFTGPGGLKAQVPAFFDGDSAWRVRFTPQAPGKYQLSRITLNGRAVTDGKPAPKQFTVSGKAGHGFVRRDPKDRTRFIYDDASPYYPIGHNVAWADARQADVPAIFDKMGKVGENWARVWMDHWDGKNLDWPMNKKLPLGQLDLEVARRWDSIVEAADRNGIAFQMVLQHHGPYSTRTDSNWGQNPWNKANGGFLATPEEFFTSPQAQALTRAKYRYIVARWGYSPGIMAWELFNEVQWVDAVANRHEKEVSDWHEAMAAFLRAQDPYHHLVTSSSDIEPQRLSTKMDYWQPHSYPSDAVSTVMGPEPLKLDRPVFFGEIGPGDNSDVVVFLRRALWSSLMSLMGGAAQLWYWDQVDARNLYPIYGSAVGFVRSSDVLSHRGLRAITPLVETEQLGPLSFGPGAGWASALRTDFTVNPSGRVEGLGQMPSFLQGQSHREMFPKATFRVNYRQPGRFAVALSQISRGGAHVAISVDGRRVAEKEFPASERDRPTRETVEGEVPEGSHVVTVENTGGDWAVVRSFTLTPYTSALGALGKGDKEYAVLWVTLRGDTPSQPATGKLSLAGMAPGDYQVNWWDTQEGKVLATRTARAASNGTLALEVPPLTHDAAVWITRAGGDR
jgi:hypothetical protein